MDRGEILDAIDAERDRQIRIYGYRQSDPFHIFCALTEEVGELAETLQETYGSVILHPERGGKDNVLKEAVQVAAMAIKIIEEVL